MHRIETETSEKEAWEFAEEFMLPEDEFLDDIPYKLTNLSSLIPLKHKWRVPFSALVMRLEKLEAISSNTARYLYSQLSKYKRNEPFPVEKEKPQIEDILIQYYQKKLGFSVDELTSLIGIYSTQLEKEFPRGGNTFKTHLSNLNI